MIRTKCEAIIRDPAWLGGFSWEIDFCSPMDGFRIFLRNSGMTRKGVLSRCHTESRHQSVILRRDDEGSTRPERNEGSMLKQWSYPSDSGTTYSSAFNSTVTPRILGQVLLVIIFCIEKLWSSLNFRGDFTEVF